jgi:hypothetical protein
MRSASLNERLLAGLVNAAVAILLVASVVGLGIGGVVAYARIRSGEDEEGADHGEVQYDVPPLDFCAEGHGVDEQHDRPGGVRRGPEEIFQSPLVRAALWGASTGLTIGDRNRRSPGFRVVGLRRVDARTGGPISVRSALVGVLFVQARQAAAKPLFRSRARREQERTAEMAPKLKKIERDYALDDEARQQALMEFYNANEANPWNGCAWLIAGQILSQLLIAVAIRDRRTLYDRLTRTIVVRDR